MASLTSAFSGGKLEKAYFVRCDGDNVNMQKKMLVQFNPAEISISRSIKMDEVNFNETASDKVKTVKAGVSSFSVTLFFDAYTSLPPDSASAVLESSIGSFDMSEDTPPEMYKEKSVLKRVYAFQSLIKYEKEGHTPPKVVFIWGENNFFKGIITSQSIRYSMFDRDGTPVRASISITMVGESPDFERVVKEFPFESPDRTKQRLLRSGEQLWMMAQEEYGDVAHWKVIAEANDILNPRMLNSARYLKVPALQ